MVTVTKPANNAAFKAFVDASSGAMGSLFAAVLLYPLDVVKTRQQVAVGDAKKKDETDATNPNEAASNHHKKPSSSNMFALCWSIYQAEGLEGLFAGLSSKMAHTLFASFAYFYWYALLKAAAEKRSGKTITTGMNLLVAALAGALNMSTTLPLEMINTRAQITSSESDSEDSDDSDDTDEKKPKTTTHKGMWALAQEIYAEGGLLAFWKGYVPSLVLVSNPSINFTVFDKLKLHMQRWKTARTGGDLLTQRLAKLTMFEAFVIAAIAKAIATVLTYPVIRAKVLMQAQKKQAAQAAPTNGDAKHHHHHHHERPNLGNSMAEVLVNIGAREGMAGYFRGCSAQLFNTVLKSALLLMTKEQIYTYTMRVLYALRRDRVARAVASKA